jgi:hypothetical protein
MPSERFDQTQGVVAEKPDRAMLASINPSKRHEAGAETAIAPPIGCAESLLVAVSMAVRQCKRCAHI